MKRYSTLEAVQRIRIPILYIHGKKDEEISVSASEEMYKISNKPKELVLIDNADHI